MTDKDLAGSRKVITSNGYTVIWEGNLKIDNFLPTPPVFYTSPAGIQQGPPLLSTMTREEALYDARKVLGDGVTATLLADGKCRMELNGNIIDAPDWELALKGVQSLQTLLNLKYKENPKKEAK